MVISLSLISMLAEVPLKSKRVPISLAVFSTPFFTFDQIGFADGVERGHGLRSENARVRQSGHVRREKHSPAGA